MVTTKIKFKASKEMPSYNGYPDGQVLEVEESGVKGLLKDYPENFEVVKDLVSPPKQDGLTKEQIEKGYKLNKAGYVVDGTGKAVSAPPSNKMLEMTDEEKEQGYKLNFKGDVVDKKGKLVRKNK